jgi:uncharacterized protein (TIGR02270 family)
VATSLRAFNTGLYEEHLEDISFLYEQRRFLLGKGEIAWRDIAPFEARLEAHLDSLVVGGELALGVCRRLAKDGDFGQLFGAISVFCRQGRAQLLAEGLKHLDFTDSEKMMAVADALKFELPEAWSSFIAQALARQEDRLIPLLATVSGYRRLPHAAALIDALARSPIDARHGIDALGRLRSCEAQGVLLGYLSHADEPLRAAALLALLRIGATEALKPADRLGRQECCPPVAFALGAERSTASMMLHALQSGDAQPECLLALGLIGDPATMRVMYESLDIPELAEAAAQALQWITGASSNEEVFVPEEVDESTLFRNELQVWKQYKEAPKRLDGQPFGEVRKMLPVKKEVWKRWFADNSTRFDPSLRYRSGQPYSPAVLLSDLVAEDSSTALRRFAALELEIRYGCEVPFEIDMPVARQFDALEKISRWVNAHGGSFQPGRWYFNGKLQ